MERDVTSARWFLLPLRGGDPIPVADVHALREQWRGARVIETRCEDGSAPDVYKRCADGDLQLFVGGRFIAADHDVMVVGFVEAEP